MRVTITRVLLNASSRDTKELPIADELFFALPATTDPESLYIRQTHRDALRTAFGLAAESLDTRDRSVLRYALVDGLGVDAIGKIYGVHRATAARWVASAKDALGTALQAALREHLRVSQSELGSIVRSMQSQLDMSVARFLDAPHAT